MNINNYHTPVLCNELINLMQIKPKGVYIDATFGGGGHTKVILSILDKKHGKLIVVDQDKTAFEKNLPKDNRIVVIHTNFKYIKYFLKYYGIDNIEGTIADLGVSSHQFDTAERGFSIMHQGPLDMRMNKQQTLTAQHIITHYSESELKRIFQDYGQVVNTDKLVKAIIVQRQIMKIETTRTLVKIVEPLAQGNRMQYLAQVFQAIRIEVNNEIHNLQRFINDCTSFIVEGGKLAIISFHSIEDKLVKQSFNNAITEDGKRIWKPLHKKPISASEQELKNNRRSRSAKLRVAVKV